MRPRYNVSPKKSPSLTGGEDEPRANCDNAWAPFEVLMHETRGPEFRAALAEARSTCGLALNDVGEVVTTPNVCPLLATCLVGSDEPWAKAILAPPKKEPTNTGACGTSAGARRHYRAGESLCEPCRVADRAATSEWKRKAREGKVKAGPGNARYDALAALAARNVTIREACEELGVERVSLYDWCRANNALILYRQLTKGSSIPTATVGRADDLRAIAANGGSITDACRALNTSRAALQKWCGRRGMHALYQQLTERERQSRNQWTGAA